MVVVLIEARKLLNRFSVFPKALQSKKKKGLLVQIQNSPTYPRFFFLASFALVVGVFVFFHGPRASVADVAPSCCVCRTHRRRGGPQPHRCNPWFPVSSIQPCHQSNATLQATGFDPSRSWHSRSTTEQPSSMLFSATFVRGGSRRYSIAGEHPTATVDCDASVQCDAFPQLREGRPYSWRSLRAAALRTRTTSSRRNCRAEQRCAPNGSRRQTIRGRGEGVY